MRDLGLDTQPWQSNYNFQTRDRIEELVDSLAVLHQGAGRPGVALVAAFTESRDNLRVGFPLHSGWAGYAESNVSIRWLMKPQEYVRFWVRGECNRLDSAASIYGAQGFESDYVGVIWGRDLVLRNAGWELGDPAICYDTIDGLIEIRSGIRYWCDGALTFIKNRYRILLTRGILGTLVFCEDTETRIGLEGVLGT